MHKLVLFKMRACVNKCLVMFCVSVCQDILLFCFPTELSLFLCGQQIGLPVRMPKDTRFCPQKRPNIVKNKKSVLVKTVPGWLRNPKLISAALISYLQRPNKKSQWSDFDHFRPVQPRTVPGYRVTEKGLKGPGSR